MGGDDGGGWGEWSEERIPNMSWSKKEWVKRHIHCRSTNLRMVLWAAREGTMERALSFS